jgi:hypothetical protein
MVMAVSNANNNEKLKLDLVIEAILDEVARQKVSGTLNSSCSALNIILEAVIKGEEVTANTGINQEESRSGLIRMVMAKASVSLMGKASL